jgi:glycine C-acetyltransferase
LAQVEAAIAALSHIEVDQGLRRQLAQNTEYFRAGLAALGADLGESTTNITPIMIRDEERALRAGAALYRAGVIMMPFVYPGVPKGTERLRCSVTAAHTEAQMSHSLAALRGVGAALGFLPDQA